MITFTVGSRRRDRRVDVYLPASYADGRRRYPVVYMHDGQNLSNPSIAFAGTWRLDEVLRDLAARGIEPIVVGVHNTRGRLAEYSPFPDRRHGGGAGERYVSFLADVLKPRIDRRFRTRRLARHTVIAGSSMGGLISLYAWFRRPDVFGHVAALSPSLWFGRDGVFDFLAAATLPRGRMYVDVGTEEGAQTLRDARMLRRLLEDKAIDGRLGYREVPGDRHEEAAWSRRIGGAIAFLIGRATR